MEFEGLDTMLEQFKELEQDIEPIAEKALIKTHEYVTPFLEEQIAKHKLSGKTQTTLNDNPEVIKDGNIRYVNLGFNIPEGGYPTIFLMYGTPSQKPDTKFKNALYGAKQRKEMNRIQQEVFIEALNEVLMNGS
jgi:hypothetical protein